ncbi:MAG: hypothetical protein WCW30_05315 [Candidatus Gracilibacteria bacterium]
MRKLKYIFAGIGFFICLIYLFSEYLGDGFLMILFYLMTPALFVVVWLEKGFDFFSNESFFWLFSGIFNAGFYYLLGWFIENVYKKYFKWFFVIGIALWVLFYVGSAYYWYMLSKNAFI